MDLQTFLITLAVGFVAAFVGAIVGGSGVVTIPALVLMGLPVPAAIATNKLGTIGLSVSSFIKYYRARHVDWRLIPLLCIWSALGAYAGARILLALPDMNLSEALGVTIVLLIPVIFLTPELGLRDFHVSPLRRRIGHTLFFLLAVFSGCFGGGVVPVMCCVMVSFYGLTVLGANGTVIIPWTLNNLVALAVFLWSGIVSIPHGLVLLIGSLGGGYVGAHTAIARGNKWVKIAYAVMIVAIAIKLLFFHS